MVAFTGELADAIRGHTNITFGLYHSLFEWFNPLYLKDSANNYQTQEYVKVMVLPLSKLTFIFLFLLLFCMVLRPYCDCIYSLQLGFAKAKLSPAISYHLIQDFKYSHIYHHD